MKRCDLVYCIKNSPSHIYDRYYKIYGVIKNMVYVECIPGIDNNFSKYFGYFLDPEGYFNEHFITLKELRRNKLKKLDKCVAVFNRVGL